MDFKGPTYPPGSDESYIEMALELAKGGLGWTSPNPLVGCVIVKDGQVIGKGYHSHYGGQHAEAEALRDAGDVRGATCYTNLEPCSHKGNQPPCCGMLAQAGIKRVVYGTTDRNRVDGNRL